MKPRRVKKNKKVAKVYAAIPKPTAFQQSLAKAKENVNFIKTQSALTALDSRYRGDLYGTEYGKVMAKMRAEIDRTMGETLGTRLPIERGLY